MIRRIVNSSLRITRVLALAAAVGVLGFGLVQLREAPVDVYPEFGPPIVEVQTEALGLSSGEVEQLITVPLEADLLNGVAWVTGISSESVSGLSSITLVFEQGTSLFQARQVVQERLAQAHALPNVSEPPQMVPPVSSTSRTMLIGLSSDSLSLIEISQLARWTIKPRLMGVEGVGNVSSFGQRERQLQVRVDPARLQQSGLDLLQVVETTGNALVVSPLTYLEASTPGTGGFIETENQRLGVRHISPIVSAEDLAQVAVVDRPELRLGDVAEIVEDHQPLIGDAIVNDEPGVLLVVEKLHGANTVDVTEGVEEALEKLAPGLAGLDMETTTYQPADYIGSSAKNIGVGLLIGLGLVIALLAFAFYQWRTALITVVSILVSLSAAGAVLYLRGTTFNSMTLAGLAVALGIIIDDAVTGTQAVARRIRDRGDRSVAGTIVDSCVELRGALGYATVFILLPLLPVAFADGHLGSFSRPLALSYTLALVASTLVALLVAPGLSALLLTGAPDGKGEGPVASKLGERYDGLLGRLLGAPSRILLPVLGILVLVGLVTLPMLRHSDLPTLEESDFVVELEAAPTTSLQLMNQLTAEVSSELRTRPGVTGVAGHVGRAVTSDQVVNVSSSRLWVSLDSESDRDSVVADLEDIVADHPELDSRVVSYQASQLEDTDEGADETDEPIVVRVYGNEPGELEEQARRVGDAMGEIDGIEDLQIELPATHPTLEVQVDLERAKAFGVKPGDVRRAAAILLSGLEVGQLFNDQKVFEVVVWATPETRESEEDIRNLLIDTPNGQQIRLSEVADVNRVDSPDIIEREGVFNRIDITAEVGGRGRDAVAEDVGETIESIAFPLEYRAELLSGFEDREADDQRVAAFAAFAALAMLLLLQACFGSWRVGALLYLSLPISLLGGALAGLALSGDVTTGAVLGLLAVLGIAARNGVVLVKGYEGLERNDDGTVDADAVRASTRERFTPTLMTAVATALAFAPFAIAGARPGYEILNPMALVVLAGLVTSTFVTLFAIPAAYLRLARPKSDTEIDIHLFEEELRASESGRKVTVGS